MDIVLRDNERIDDLQYKGLRIIQKKDGFCFGIDSVLIANFADAKKCDIIIDLGTGTGIIPLLLAGRTEAYMITGLEIQAEMCEMAKRSVLLNNLQDKINIVCGDIKNAPAIFGQQKFNVVVANPPYMNVGGGLVSPSDTKAISRHEVMCTLEDVINASSKLLMPGGQFAMVHRPERLVDIICLMRSYRIEPKYLRFVHSAPSRKANLVLVKGRMNGNPQLRMMEPLYIYDENGNYSEEINKIYHRDVISI